MTISSSLDGDAERKSAAPVPAPGEPSVDLRTRYARDGYVIVEGADVLEGLDADGIWERFAPAFAAGADRVQDAWTDVAAVRAIATHPAVMATLRELYGREPIPFQSLNFRCGSEQRTHSDTIHFSTLPSGFMCGVWVALEDVTLEQGPLHYYPGSHTLADSHYEQFGIPVPPYPFDWSNPVTRTSYAQYEDSVEQMIRAGGFKRHELAVKRGSYLVWSANLFHGGSPVADRRRTRKSQVTHYFFADTVLYAPMYSRRRDKRYLIRPVRNIVTGEYALPTLDGNPVLFERAPDGLRTIVEVRSLPQRLMWNIVKRRPMPDIAGAMTFRNLQRRLGLSQNRK